MSLRAYSMKNKGHNAVIHYACAGDDHVGVSAQPHRLKAIPTFLESMGFEISWDKYRISKKYVHYCQDFGYSPKLKLDVYEDTPRLRLLNQFRKGGSHDNFSEPDPLLGKVKDLERRMRFMEENERGTPGEKNYNLLLRWIPFALRLLMPTYADKKVMCNMQSYLPSWYGGIGIPTQFLEEVMSDKKVNTLARRFVRYRTSLMADQSGQIWERGIESFMKKFNIMAYLGVDFESLPDTPKIFAEVQERITTLYASTQVGRRRVMRTVHEEFVNVSKPCSLMTAKEQPYVKVASGSFKLMTIKPLRAGQRLRAMARMLKDTEPVDLLPPREEILTAGLWMARSELKQRTGTFFVVPNLSIPLQYLMDRRMKNRDERVNLIVPYIPEEMLLDENLLCLEEAGLDVRSNADTSIFSS
jgi:hypothetical protein